MSHVYCPECGFQNPEAANYCTKCGARLIPESPGETTESFTPEDVADDAASVLESTGFRSHSNFKAIPASDKSACNYDS